MEDITHCFPSPVYELCETCRRNTNYVKVGIHWSFFAPPYKVDTSTCEYYYEMSVLEKIEYYEKELVELDNKKKKVNSKIKKIYSECKHDFVLTSSNPEINDYLYTCLKCGYTEWR